MNVYVVETQKLRSNVEILKKKAGSSTLWAVVKGDGYGLGAGKLASFFRSCGIDHFAVTALPEARSLRDAGLTGESILMLQPCQDREQLTQLLKLGVICTLGCVEDGQLLSAIAADLGLTAQAHVKIDTGMGRYGFQLGQEEEAASLWKLPHVTITGMFTHFHSGSQKDVTEQQFGNFGVLVESLKAMGLDPGMVHCCNSLAFRNFPHMHLDAVRLGSALLGRVGYARAEGLQPIGYCQAQVEAVRQLPRGHNVGYGRGCKLKKDTTIAVVGVGYIHGFAVERGYDLFRPKDCLRNMGRYLKYWLKGKCLTVTIGGKPCPVLGHVGMVNLVADVTGLKVRPGDLVTVPINPLDLKQMEIQWR